MDSIDLATDAIIYASMTPRQRAWWTKWTLLGIACSNYVFLLTAPTAMAATYTGGSTGIDDPLLVTVPILASTAAITGAVLIFAATPPLAVKVVHYMTLGAAAMASIAILVTDTSNENTTAVFGLVPALCVIAAVCLFFGSRINSLDIVSAPLL